MRLLVVEDENHLREQLQTFLCQLGYVVDAAADGREGLYFGEEYPYDLAVIDIGLPEIDGIELIRSIRRIHADLKVLAISGGGMYQDPKLATQLAAATGASRVLRKPVSNDELLDEVALLVSPESA